jgi:2'-5' RNA ligase
MTTPPAPARLFLAAWPDAGVAERVDAWRGTLAWPPRARLTPRDGLHVTLHFIGNVAREHVARIADGLAVDFEPHAMALARPALWHGGIAVLGADAGGPALELHARLAAALRALELPVETRPWRPHLTLARQAGGIALPEAGPEARWRVGHYALAESGGGRYTVLRRYPARVWPPA